VNKLSFSAAASASIYKVSNCRGGL